MKNKGKARQVLALFFQFLIHKINWGVFLSIKGKFQLINKYALGIFQQPQQLYSH